VKAEDLGLTEPNVMTHKCPSAVRWERVRYEVRSLKLSPQLSKC
jgi:hypothetical protein